MGSTLLSSRRSDYGLHEAEEKSESFCRQMIELRKNRDEERSSRIEVVKLRDENKILKERCSRYQRMLETSGDPDVIRKFFEYENKKCEESEEIQKEIQKET